MEAIKKPGRPRGTTKVRLPILCDEYETLMMHLEQSVVKHSIRERLRLSFFLLKEFGFRSSEVLQITYDMID